MTVLPILILGASGRMGQAVSLALSEDGFSAASLIDQGDSINLDAISAVIDFSSPKASLEALEACANEGISRHTPLAHIIGTTGFTEDEIEKISHYQDQVVIVRSGNFSLGINILMGLLRQSAALLPAKDWDIEIIESHHRHKRDAPSGTALMLGEAAALGRGQMLSSIRVDDRSLHDQPRQTGTIGFATVRAGGIVGDHQAVIASSEEIITLGHTALNRTLFAKGAISAAHWAMGKKAGLYDMQNVLGFNDH